MILNIHVSNTYYSLVRVHKTHKIIYNNSNFSIFHYTIYQARFGSELNNNIDLYIFSIYSLTQKGLRPCDLSNFFFFPRIQKTTIDLLQSEVMSLFRPRYVIGEEQVEKFQEYLKKNPETVALFGVTDLYITLVHPEHLGI